jgi:hypothetical protein
LHYKKLSAFYRDLLELIVAVIIGQSFFQADAIFIPLSKVLVGERGIVDGLGMFMAYFIVISGWIGYYRSVNKEPHKGRAGNMRFVLDLAIVFLTYYIVSVANPTSAGHFGDIFQWVLPVMFIFYLLWDVTKTIEYNNDVNNADIRFRRMITTAIFAAAFILLSFIYTRELSSWGQAYPTNPPWNKTHFDVVYIIASIILVGLYRFLKWDDKRRPSTDNEKGQSKGVTA